MMSRMARDGQPIDPDVPLTPATTIRIDTTELMFKVSKDLRFSQDFKFVPDASAACLKLLEIKPDGTPGESYALPPAGRSLFIGRDPSQCKIALSNCKKVSRKHAQVIIYDKMALLMDMHAKNGTFVNGRKVRRKVIHPGDIANLANVRLLLCYTG
jgi:pSer/pThr/pTyr-binding forkhead associated (FHA) protein